MNYPVFEEDDLPRPMAPSAPREEIPVPVFAVPDVSIVVDKTPARRQTTYQEWQKKANLVFLEGRSKALVPQDVPQVPPETFHPALERRSPQQDASGQDEVIKRLENLLASYSNQLEGQIQRMSHPRLPEKAPTAEKSVSVSPQQRSIGVQCDLLLPEAPRITRSSSSQTDSPPELVDNRRASDSCLQGGFFTRNPGQSDAWSTEMSMGTRQYMEKHNLLGDQRSSGTPSPNRNVLEGIKGQRTLVAFGNPILDMSIAVEDGEVVKRHGLKANDQLEIPIEKLMDIKRDAEERCGKSVKLNPGGSSLNTCRILRACQAADVLFCGSIGRDENGERLQELIRDSGVSCLLQRLESSTAVCLCLIQGTSRCLLADIGAAKRMEHSWLVSEALEEILKARILYIEGYFVPERFAICWWLVEEMGSGRTLAVNLSARYIVRSLKEEFTLLVEACDLIFGNSGEFSALAETLGHNFDDWLENFARAAEKKKLLVITNGEFSVELIEIAKGELRRQKVCVPKVENVKDTTGAGDAFVAGFLHAFRAKKSPRECVEQGISVSRRTLSQIGCHFAKGVSE